MREKLKYGTHRKLDKVSRAYISHVGQMALAATASDEIVDTRIHFTHFTTCKCK